MSKKCPICGRGIGVYQDYVGGTSFFKCDICGHTGCDFEDMTVFDQITQSYETLAEKLVYQAAVEGQKTVNDRFGNGVGVQPCIYYVWKSAVTSDDTYTSKEEALAATLTKLKEVMK